MSNAVEPKWHGDDYQARFFWLKAAGLRNPSTSHCIEVTFEADGPKAFDDVIVRYSPGRPSVSGLRIEVDHYQVKFHANQSGRFGFEDLPKAEFIGASKVSMLQNLAAAKKVAPAHSAFHLITSDRISDGDVLNDLVNTKDRSLRLNVLFDGTTDASKFGKVRKLWREHLSLASDDELREVVDGLHVNDNFVSITDLRDQVNTQFQIAGLTPFYASTGFPPDDVAQKLKMAKRNRFTRQEFEEFCHEEKWVCATPSEQLFELVIQSFPDTLANTQIAEPENFLILTDHFVGRHLDDGRSWATDVTQPVQNFLRVALGRCTRRIRLHLEAHLSIAFLAGSVLTTKAGPGLELWQKGRGAPAIWNADDRKLGAMPTTEEHPGNSEHEDVAIVISVSRDAFSEVQDFLSTTGISVGRIFHVLPANGIGQGAILGGTHAFEMAEYLTNQIKKAKIKFGATRHIFLAAPNAFAFYLGQQSGLLGQVQLYEYDFSNTKNGTYVPSVRLP